MRAIILFLCFVITFSSFANCKKVKYPDNLLLQDAIYILDGENVETICDARNFSRSHILNSTITISDMNFQRELSTSSYDGGVFNESEQTLFANSINQLFSGRINRTYEQQLEIHRNMQSARELDRLIEEEYRSYNELVECIRKDRELQKQAEQNIERSLKIQKRMLELFDSDFPEHKKEALLNLIYMKIDREEHKGKLKDKFNILRDKYQSTEEVEFKSEKSYPFLTMGVNAYKHAVEEYKDGKGDLESAENSLELSNTFLDIATGVTPFIGTFRDAYEAFTGENLIDGTKLSSSERVIAMVGFGVGVFTGGTLGGVAKGLAKIFPKALRYVDEAVGVIGSARKLGLKAKYEISNFVQLSKQVLRADTNTFKHIDKIAKSVSKVSPKLGDKYVKQLPDLTGSFKEAFEGTIHKGTFKPGEVFFQALRTGQDKPGRWFTPIKPIDANHADELLNIRKWGNEAGQLRVFKVKESVSGYAGKVEGGSGHQFFIPNDVPLSDVIEEIILD